jgi:hypothetical protein
VTPHAPRIETASDKKKFVTRVFLWHVGFDTADDRRLLNQRSIFEKKRRINT